MSVVASVMDLHRRGGLRRATLYAVDAEKGDGGQANLKDCVAAVDGTVRAGWAVWGAAAVGCG